MAMGAIIIYKIMSTYVFDVYEDGEFYDRISTKATSYDEAELLTVMEFGDEIELVRIEITN